MLYILSSFFKKMFFIPDFLSLLPEGKYWPRLIVRGLLSTESTVGDSVGKLQATKI